MALLSQIRGRFDSGFTSSDRSAIEKLYAQVCSKHVRRGGCQDCYRDAFIEIYTKLKRLGTMPKIPNYVLKAGALIHPFGTSEFYTLSNIPDDVAEEHLAKYPKQIALFEKYPSDWQERAANRIATPADAETGDAADGAKEGEEVEKSEKKSAKTLKPLATRKKDTTKE